MCLPELQPALLSWAELGAAPSVPPTLLAAIPTEVPQLGGPGDSHKVTLTASLQLSLSQHPPGPRGDVSRWDTELRLTSCCHSTVFLHIFLLEVFSKGK